MRMPDVGRVIAGTARGVRLEGAPSGTRALSDRVKQSLFASLEAEGALDGPFLDLFAGTGAAGIEALSRGAPAATFVENNPKATSLINANLQRTGLPGGRVVRDEVLRFLTRDRQSEEARFSAVLLDPPYGDPVLGDALLALTKGPWIAQPAIVVAKHFWRDEPPETVGSLRRTRQKRFGETTLSFYTRAE
jgi:16S rRNA (guanine966-N2)-methyltransferase